MTLLIIVNIYVAIFLLIKNLLLKERRFYGV